MSHLLIGSFPGATAQEALSCHLCCWDIYVKSSKCYAQLLFHGISILSDNNMIGQKRSGWSGVRAVKPRESFTEAVNDLGGNIVSWTNSFPRCAKIPLPLEHRCQESEKPRSAVEETEMVTMETAESWLALYDQKRVQLWCDALGQTKGIFF